MIFHIVNRDFTNIIYVTVLVFKGDKLLAVSRKDNPNDFGLPGGKIDMGESLEEACIRELKEETGLIATKLCRIYDRAEPETAMTVCRCFLIEEYTGEINTNESGIVAWVDPIVITKGTFGSYNRGLIKAVPVLFGNILDD